MAEVKDNELDDGMEEEKKGGFKALIIPVLTSALTAAIVGAVFTFVLAPKQQTEQPKTELEHAAEQHTKDESPKLIEPTALAEQTGIYHNYDPFIVSVFDREKVHYLKVVLSLELSEEGIKEEIAAKNPQIRDAMIFVLSDFTLRELLDNQAKNLLKEILIKTLNKILGKGKIINVYFTEFTIQ